MHGQQQEEEELIQRHAVVVDNQFEYAHDDEEKSDLHGAANIQSDLIQSKGIHRQQQPDHGHFCMSPSEPKMVETPESPSTPTDELLGPYDILCGRNKMAFNHIGNRRFRVTISLNLQAYMNARSRKEKAALITFIVDYLTQEVGARFVTLTGSHPKHQQKQRELTPRQARQKVQHALRDLAISTEERMAQQHAVDCAADIVVSSLILNGLKATVPRPSKSRQSMMTMTSSNPKPERVTWTATTA